MIPLPYDLAELAKRFPKAAGTRPNAAGQTLTVEDFWHITRTAFLESRPYREGREIDWADEPGLQAAMFFEAFLNGEKQRAAGGLYESSHTWAVAYDMRFDRDLLAKGYNPAMLALVGGSHDIGETANKLGHDAAAANQFVAERCWAGSRAEAGTILLRLEALTDSPHLSGKARLDEQERRFRDHNQMDRVARRARIYDKLNLVEVDAWLRYHGQLSDADTLIRAEQAGVKFDIIRHGRDMGELPDRIFQRYFNAAKYLTQEASDIEQQPKATMPIDASAASVAEIMPPRRPFRQFPAQVAAFGLSAINAVRGHSPLPR